MCFIPAVHSLEIRWKNSDVVDVDKNRITFSNDQNKEMSSTSSSSSEDYDENELDNENLEARQQRLMDHLTSLNMQLERSRNM